MSDMSTTAAPEYNIPLSQCADMIFERDSEYYFKDETGKNENGPFQSFIEAYRAFNQHLKFL